MQTSPRIGFLLFTHRLDAQFSKAKQDQSSGQFKWKRGCLKALCIAIVLSGKSEATSDIDLELRLAAAKLTLPSRLSGGRVMPSPPSIVCSSGQLSLTTRLHRCAYFLMSQFHNIQFFRILCSYWFRLPHMSQSFSETENRWSCSLFRQSTNCHSLDIIRYKVIACMTVKPLKLATNLHTRSAKAHHCWRIS